LKRHAKRARDQRRQLGQFLTPQPVARRVAAPPLAREPGTVLEPSFGDGAFLIPIIEHFVDREAGSTSARLGRVLTERVWGVEIDAALYERALAEIHGRWGPLPHEHNLMLGDYFKFEPGLQRFDAIIGNPPFGGTFDAAIEDELDRRYGSYGGSKLKKETYSFFIAKALTELASEGILAFICSDTFLTIKTMAGLRKLLIDSGSPTVHRLSEFSDETKYDMVTLTLEAGAPAGCAAVFGEPVRRKAMEATGNYSWTVNEHYAKLFDGPTLGDFIVATGGMTIGRNELFVREMIEHTIIEPLDFSFGEEPITLEGELSRARLGKLSPRQQQAIRREEVEGKTRRMVVTAERDEPVEIELPHLDYRYYNKASGERIYADPTHAIFWKDEGDAVLTFKKSGNWYLRGVGGGPFFGREGITWQLVAPKITARYLPPGYILDSGAPCAFLRDGVAGDELWFVLAWLQTDLASAVLKDVINHTRNIQGKDVERLPYPWWVGDEDRDVAVRVIRDAVEALQSGEQVDRVSVVTELNDVFCPTLPDPAPIVRRNTKRRAPLATSRALPTT
jgi:Eco57I restriction-modification methylase